MSENLYNSFRDRLKELIKDEPPFAWGVKAGIPSGSFNRIWNGRNLPKIDHLLTICEHTGVSLDWLVKGIGPKYREQDKNKTAPGEQVAAPIQSDRISKRSKERVKEVIILLEKELERTGGYLEPEKKAEKVIEFIEAFEDLRPVNTPEKQKA